MSDKGGGHGPSIGGVFNGIFGTFLAFLAIGAVIVLFVKVTNVPTTVPLSLIWYTDDGTKNHTPGSAPAGAIDCVKTINGVRTRGKCWD